MHSLTDSPQNATTSIPTGSILRPKAIAFYLPQFHPIPENDKWWGKGFTEWTNVTRAKPLFDGHYQPRLPADLGFYDLRLREVRHQQIALAKKYRIYGFCYHYYWFSGKRLLDRPLNDMLVDPDSDFPFCVCWANENWTRRWDARENEILIAQRYAPEDALAFIKSVEPFLRDARYIRVNGAPLLIVYRPQQLPEGRHFTRIWREYCKSIGIPEIHLTAALTHGNEQFRSWGFDSGVQFPPHNLSVEPVNVQMSFFERFRGQVLQYHDVAQQYLSKTYGEPFVFRTIFPSWDNTPRRRDLATVVLNGTPRNYEFWLSETIRKCRNMTGAPAEFVFINAWNEWAEGCYLEPDQHFGHEFLEATERALLGRAASSEFADRRIPAANSDNEARTLSSDLKEVFYRHFDRAVNRTRLFFNRHPKLKNIIRPLVRFRV